MDIEVRVRPTHPTLDDLDVLVDISQVERGAAWRRGRTCRSSTWSCHPRGSPTVNLCCGVVDSAFKVD
jgi:hypothetical protein